MENPRSFSDLKALKISGPIRAPQRRLTECVPLARLLRRHRRTRRFPPHNQSTISPCEPSAAMGACAATPLRRHTSLGGSPLASWFCGPAGCSHAALRFAGSGEDGGPPAGSGGAGPALGPAGTSGTGCAGLGAAGTRALQHCTAAASLSHATPARGGCRGGRDATPPAPRRLTGPLLVLRPCQQQRRAACSADATRRMQQRQQPAGRGPGHVPAAKC